MSDHPLQDKRIYFMGIGGIGMSALAELALARGAVVAGCDREVSENTVRLEQLGIAVAIGHEAAGTADYDLLVYTSAIPIEERETARRGRPAMRRGTFLAEVMAGSDVIGVCGTHGKTSTTWMIAHILLESGLDPNLVLGGIAPGLESNLHIGSRNLFVAELDESDESFLEPVVTTAVITNIESDHLHHYGTDEKLLSAFESFSAGVESSGLLVACADNPYVQTLLKKHKGRFVSYGMSGQAMLRASDIGYVDGMLRFTVSSEGKDISLCQMAVAGHHNVSNALAALAVAMDCGVTFEQCAKALDSFRGVQRRMQRFAEMQDTIFYSDYAHHPTEVAAAIEGARMMHTGGLTVVFQPHLYSRTRDYAEAFGEALAKADRVALVPIYPAREEPIPGVDSQLIEKSIVANGGRCVGVIPLESLVDHLQVLTENTEALILMGAGSIGTTGHELLEQAACRCV